MEAGNLSKTLDSGEVGGTLHPFRKLGKVGECAVLGCLFDATSLISRLSYVLMRLGRVALMRLGADVFFLSDFCCHLHPLQKMEGHVALLLG